MPVSIILLLVVRIRGQDGKIVPARRVERELGTAGMGWLTEEIVPSEKEGVRDDGLPLLREARYAMSRS